MELIHFDRFHLWTSSSQSSKHQAATLDACQLVAKQHKRRRHKLVKTGRNVWRHKQEHTHTQRESRVEGVTARPSSKSEVSAGCPTLPSQWLHGGIKIEGVKVTAAQVHLGESEHSRLLNMAWFTLYNLKLPKKVNSYERRLWITLKF